MTRVVASRENEGKAKAGVAHSSLLMNIWKKKKKVVQKSELVDRGPFMVNVTQNDSLTLSTFQFVHTCIWNRSSLSQLHCRNFFLWRYRISLLVADTPGRVMTSEPAHTAANYESDQWQSGVTHQGRQVESRVAAAVWSCARRVSVWKFVRRIQIKWKVKKKKAVFYNKCLLHIWLCGWRLWQERERLLASMFIITLI